MRALPAGLVLLAFRRRLPHGDWWWKAVAARAVQHRDVLPAALPGRLPAPRRPRLHPAGHVAARGDGAGLRWPSASVPARARILSAARRPGRRRAAGAALARPPRHARPGRRRSARCSSPRWASCWSSAGRLPVDMLTLVSWQLVVGGVVLVPVVPARRGRPAAPRRRQRRPGYLWLATAGTALAYWCWFRGLRPDARRRRVPGRAGQPGGRHPARRRVRRRGLRLAAGARHGAGARRRRRRPAVRLPARAARRTGAGRGAGAGAGDRARERAMCVA